MKELVAIFPVLRDWIAEFLSENKCMIASDVGHNMLIEQVHLSQPLKWLYSKKHTLIVNANLLSGNRYRTFGWSFFLSAYMLLPYFFVNKQKWRSNTL